MTKGRIFAPATSCDGAWFEHRGDTTNWPPNRTEQTNTGIMLSEPYKTDDIKYPPVPPPKYLHKDSKNFKNQNSFSAHDNRNSFQDHGVYFSDGRDNRLLGKRLTASTNRQHFTGSDYLKHNDRAKTDYYYDTVYASTYEGKATSHPPTNRRFPKAYKEGVPGYAKLDTSTTDWFRSPDIPHKTPTHVLAVSQQPFLEANKFKYSYHGLSRCYPPYDKVSKKKSQPVWLLQGSAKPREPERVTIVN